MPGAPDPGEGGGDTDAGVTGRKESHAECSHGPHASKHRYVRDLTESSPTIPCGRYCC